MTGSIPGQGRVLAVLCVLAVGVAVATGPVGATAPGEPISFHGAAADASGTPAPEGTVVVAAVDGEEVDRVTVSEPGVYASDGPTDEKLRTHTQAGDTVTFHVGSADGPQAAETHDVDESGVFAVDLTFPAGTFEAAETPPDDDGGNTSSGGGGGGGGATGGDAEPGEEAGGTVTVELTLSAENASAGGGVTTGSVSVSASANSTVEIELVDGSTPGNASDAAADQDGSASDAGAVVERIEVDVVDDVTGSLSVRQNDGSPPEGAQQFESDDGTTAVGYLEVETDLTDAQVAGARIDFRLPRSGIEDLGAAPEDVALYHYDEAAGTWTELPTAVLDESADTIRFRAETDGFSEFAAGVKRARLGITEAVVDRRTVTVGEGIAVDVAVANSGGADGSLALDLLVDGDRVGRTTLSVPANATRSTVLEHDFDEPGAYRLRVDNRSLGTVEVESQADGGADQSSQDADDPTKETDGSTDAADAAGDFLPGGRLVAVLALLAVVGSLVAAVILLRRR